MGADRNSRSGEPGRAGLVAVRRALFRLHKRLIDAERSALERRQGPVSSGEFLQALINDPALAWLQPFTSVIVEVDEALAADAEMSETEARRLLLKVRELVEPEDAGVSEHYAAVRQRDPDVLLAHVELAGNVQSALD